MKIKYPIKDPHTFSVEETLKMFQTDPVTGISPSDAANRSKEFGLNIYEARKQESAWWMIIRQFNSPIVYLLLVGIAVSVYFQDYIEGIAIGAVILINAMIGFFMEFQAHTSMKALRKMDIILCKVIRDGKTKEIPSEKLAPGDIVVLEAGDVIPGDGRLIELNQLQCDESSLTGESMPSEKNTEKLPKATDLADRQNMVFKGTSVINGNAKAVITGIAHNTQLGTITSLVENASETETPLDKKLNSLGKKLILLTLTMIVIFAITGYIQGKAWVIIIKTSIALAVAAFPEGLPIVATVALAYGMQLMAKRHVIVKKLSSVETLGSTNVILTDKTGTLTQNKIFVDTFAFPEETIKAHIDKNNLTFEDGGIKKSTENFEKLKLTGALCNNATLKTEKQKTKALGDPIEIALMHLFNTSDKPVDVNVKYKRIAEIPFNSDIKIMGTLHKGKEGDFAAAKGSVEHLLKKCSSIQFGTAVRKLNENENKNILAESEKMASDGLRVLAFAYNLSPEINKEDFLKDLIYIGMIGFLDPPRLDIKDAIVTCRKAGIKIVMITGDHPMTALNIARMVGLVDEGKQNVMTGKDLLERDSTTSKWRKKILSTAIFARTTPKQKLDIAEVYQKEGNIVAMIGDGVNDAPALKKADIGIAMGLRGTQVAKETAGIVLKDDSFTSIVHAVSQGRAIFQNIQKFVIYLVSCNLSEILIVTTLGFIAPSSTLLPLQILFLNMVTDVFPALALGLGKGDENVMENPPKDPKENIVSNKNWLDIVTYSSIITLSVIFAVIYCRETITTNTQVANNVAFITLAFAQLFHVFNMSSSNSKLLVNDISKNKFIWLAFVICTGLLLLVYVLPHTRLILSLAELPAKAWMVSLLFSLLPLVCIQVYKRISEKRIFGTSSIS